MVHALRNRKVIDKFHQHSAPTGHVLQHVRQNRERSLASTIYSCVSHVGAPAHNVAPTVLQPFDSQQVTDVRSEPVGARLDEQIVI